MKRNYVILLILNWFGLLISWMISSPQSMISNSFLITGVLCVMLYFYFQEIMYEYIKNGEYTLNGENSNFLYYGHIQKFFGAACLIEFFISQLIK